MRREAPAAGCQAIAVYCVNQLNWGHMLAFPFLGSGPTCAFPPVSCDGFVSTRLKG